MAKRTEEAILNFYDLLLLTVKEEGDKKGHLLQASFELERVKHYLRLCLELKLLPVSQYEYASRSVSEIGKLLGGWIKKQSKGAGQ